MFTYTFNEFTSSGGLSISVAQRVLVGDETQDGYAQVQCADGSAAKVPYYARTPVTLSGPANGTVYIVGTSLDDKYSLTNLLNDSGLGAAGEITLDSSGKGMFWLTSKGAFSDLCRFSLSASLQNPTSPASGLQTLSGPSANQTASTTIAVVSKKVFTGVMKSTCDFMGLTDPTDPVGVAYATAGGFFVIGDIGSVV